MVIATCMYTVQCIYSYINLPVQLAHFCLYLHVRTVYTVLSTSMYTVHRSKDLHVLCTQFYLHGCTVYTVLSTYMYIVQCTQFYKPPSHRTNQSERHSVSSIWNQTSFCLLFNNHLLYGFVYLYIFIQNAYANKKVFKKRLTNND